MSLHPVLRFSIAETIAQLGKAASLFSSFQYASSLKQKPYHAALAGV